MSRMKSVGFYLTPLLLLAGAVSLWIYVLKPMTIGFLVRQIPVINASQDFATLEVDSIDLSILKLQLVARGLSVKFKKDLGKQPPLVADYVSAQLDIFDLIVGQINLSKVTIESLQWSPNLASDSSRTKVRLPVGEIFKLLEIIPIDRVIIFDSGLKLTSDEFKNQIKFQIPQLTITNKRNEILLATNNFSTQFAKEGEDGVNLDSDFNLTLNKNELTVNKLELRLLSSHVGLTARFTSLEKIFDAPEGQLKFRGKVNLEDVRTVALNLFPQKSRISSVMGLLEANGELSLNSADDMSGTVDVNTTQVVWDHFKLGQAKIKATLKNNQVEINEVNLEHPSGKASLKNVKFDKKSPHGFSTSIEVDKFDLQKLFISLGLTKIPAGLLGSGKSFCTGYLKPEPEARCRVEADLTDIWVKTSLNDGFTILKLKQGGVTGEASFNKTGMTYHSDLRVGGSKGTSHGTLNFKEGFDIKFDTPQLSFKDVESLAGLNIVGDLKINGSTRGDTESAVMKANISTRNAEIDEFFLGDFESILEYKSSTLNFDAIKGRLGNTDYAGDLNFNFSDSTVAGDFRLPDFRGEDILRVISQKFSLPFSLTGKGKGNVRFKGPFDFWKLSYELDSELKNGTIAGESFSQLSLDLAADSDKILFKNVRLRKIKSDFTLSGIIDTTSKEPQFNLKLRANPLLLEETDRIIAYAPAIAGVGYAEGQITGPLGIPELTTNFTLNQVSYDKVDYPNSQGKIRINKDFLNFNGQFFGRQIQSDFTWPWNPNDSFSAKVLIHDLNPLFLLPLISLPQPGADFNSRLNAEIDLTSKNRNLSSADGYIKITEFVLQRGTQSLKLEKPSSLIFRSGLSQMENIYLTGNESFLSVKMNQNTPNQVRLAIKADLQLRLLHFLVPFAQSLSGNLVADSQVILKGNSFELLGEGELTDGYISLKGFPQAIESLNTPIEFSKSKIFLSDITGQFAQSDVTGIGQIEILGPKNIQVNLRAVADSIELNFPDQISTGGRASILFTGNWLPYDLKIDYKVSHGLVENDFEAGSGNQSLSLKASSFLPPKQFEQLSPSLALDINVDLTRGIIIKNKLIEGEAVGILNITGSPESPVIKGKIDIKPGSKLIFKDKPFNIQTASINFQQTREINPDIYISGNARIADYDINLLVQGPAKNMSIKPTSQPPLSEPDLFSLLALGVTSQTDSNLSSETQQKQTGLEVLAAISNQSQLNKKIQEKLGLTVQLAPSVDSTKNIAVPKVVVSKKLSDKFNASYSKPFTGNDQNQEIKLQYLYNSNVSLLLNYQNKDTSQQDQISNTNSNNKGILGFDLEYRDEFK